MTERSRKSLQKIILHSERATSYTEDMTQAMFSRDSKTLEAVVFNVSQIGELARLIDAETICANPHIDWVAMRGLRNRIVHDYDHVSPSIIWAVVKNDLPQLIIELQKILITE